MTHVRSLVVVAACLLAACTREGRQATEVLLEIDADEGVQDRLSRLEIRIRGGAQDDKLSDFIGEAPQTLVQPSFPLRVGLIPRKGDASRLFDVTVVAYTSSGDFLAESRLVSGYVAGSLRFARITLEGACIGESKRCAADDDEAVTCREGRCVTARVDAEDLSTSRSRPTPVATDGDTGEPNHDGSANTGTEDGGAKDAGALDASASDAGSVDASADAAPAHDAAPLDANPIHDASPLDATGLEPCVLGKSRLPCVLGP